MRAPETAGNAPPQAAPDFDADWYRRTYPDVGLSGMDPAEHFRLIGRPLGRRGGPAASGTGPAGGAAPGLEEVARAVAAIAPRPQGTVRADGVGDGAASAIVDAPEPVAPPPAAHRAVPVSGAGAGLVACGDQVVARLAAASTGAALQPVLRAFARVMNLPPDALFSVVAAPGATPVAELSRDLPRGFRSLAPGSADLRDAWYSATSLMTLSLEPRAANLTLRAFQCDAADHNRMCLIGQQQLPDEGPVWVELALANPLFPILIEIAGPDGGTRDLALMAFPSLFRGGMHHAELLAGLDGETPMEAAGAVADRALALLMAGRDPAPGRIGTLAVSVAEATGTEPIFSAAMLRWIGLFGVNVTPVGHENPDLALATLGLTLPRPATVRAGLVLHLPAGGFPTIAALVAPLPADAAGPVPFLVADRLTFRPRWSVQLPASQSRLAAFRLPGKDRALPMLSAEAGVPPSGAGTPAAGALPPLAICVQDAGAGDLPSTLFPLAADAPGPVFARASAPAAGVRVTCLLQAQDAARARRFLRALAAQRGAAVLDVVLLPRTAALSAEIGPDLAQLFPGRFHALQAGARPVDAIAAPGGLMADHLFLADDITLLHDPRTLETLLTVAQHPGTGSVGCTAVFEVPGRPGAPLEITSCGHFPARIGLSGPPRVVFDQPDVSRLLPGMTFPVAAVGLGAALVARAAAAAVCACAGAATDPLRSDAGFGLELIAAGYANLMTTAVSVTRSLPRINPETRDPRGAARIGPPDTTPDWASLLAQVTLVRDLR